MIEPVNTLTLFSTFMIPFVSGLLLFLLDGRVADIVMLSSSGATSALQALITLEAYLTGYRAEHITLLKSTQLGEVFGFIIDPLSVSVGFVVATAGFAFMLYSVKYMTPENKQHPVHKGKGRFYGWMMIFIGTTLAFLYSSTLIQLLMFFELMSISCWGVVSYYMEPESIRASYKALITTHLGALIGLFTAISYCIGSGISTSLYSLSHLPSDAKLVIYVAVMIAALAKSAQFPFYSWLPDAMVAPTPASAFLHGAAMVEMGVVLLARVIQFMQPLPSVAGLILAVFVTLTFFTVSYMLLPQRDAKRLLAYSTIAESASMYAGLVAASAGYVIGLRAAIFLLLVHAYVKGLAFLTAGLYSHYLGTLDMGRIKGLMSRSKFTAFSWAFSLLGLAAVPPMPVFFGEVFIVLSLLTALVTHPYALYPLLGLFTYVIVFFMVALKWLHSMLLTEAEGGRFRLSWVFVASMLILIVLALASPALTIGFVNNIQVGGVAG